MNFRLSFAVEKCQKMKEEAEETDDYDYEYYDYADYYDCYDYLEDVERIQGRSKREAGNEGKKIGANKTTIKKAERVTGKLEKH